MKEKISHNWTKHQMERMRGGVDALLSADIPDQYKILALLAASGVKPASEWDIPYREDSKARIEYALKSFGVPYTAEIVTNHGGQYVHFSIARDAVVLEQLQALHGTPHTKHSAAWHERYGALLGFPRTAVHSFLHHLDKGSVYAPDEIKNTDVGKFIDLLGGFRLSEAHWRQEIETVHKWMAVIHDMSPEYLKYLLSKPHHRPGGSTH